MTFKVAVYKYVWCLNHRRPKRRDRTHPIAEYETAYWSNPISGYREIRLKQKPETTKRAARTGQFATLGCIMRGRTVAFSRPGALKRRANSRLVGVAHRVVARRLRSLSFSGHSECGSATILTGFRYCDRDERYRNWKCLTPRTESIAPLPITGGSAYTYLQTRSVHFEVGREAGVAERQSRCEGDTYCCGCAVDNSPSRLR